MRTLLLTFLLVFTLLPAVAIKKIEANPVNLAFLLSQETDSAKMSSICEYYGYISQPSQDGYAVYRHPKNSSVIRYSFKGASTEQPYPYVEVKSNIGAKDTDFTLTDLKFNKAGSGYVRKLGQYARSTFQCKHGPHGFLIFHQTKLPKDW